MLEVAVIPHSLRILVVTLHRLPDNHGQSPPRGRLRQATKGLQATTKGATLGDWNCATTRGLLTSGLLSIRWSPRLRWRIKPSLSWEQGLREPGDVSLMVVDEAWDHPTVMFGGAGRRQEKDRGRTSPTKKHTRRKPCAG